MHRQKIRVTADTLDAARRHVLLSLPADASATTAERMASPLTQDFILRVRGQRYQSVRVHGQLSDRKLAALRRSIEKACDPVGLYVLHLHYGERWPLSSLATQINITGSELSAAREGVRALTRMLLDEAGADEGLGTLQALDAILADIALAPYGTCPPTDQLLDADGRDHSEHCPRCGRAIRLLQAGVLVLQDLAAPPALPAPKDIAVLALQLHPEAGARREALIAQFPGHAHFAGEDFLLIDVEAAPKWRLRLEQRLRVGQPQRDHIRGALLSGNGIWIAKGLLGPVALDALEKTRAQPWGQVDGIDALPSPLPPPPSVGRWWTIAWASSAIALLAGLATLRPESAKIDYPMTGSYAYDGGAISVWFDVDDRAHLDVWALDASSPPTALLSSPSPATKAELATHRGDFEVVTIKPRLVLVSADEPMPEMAAVLEGLAGVERARFRDVLAERVSSLYPGAQVRYLDTSLPKHEPF
jgi:hypothetical protein